MWHDYLNNPVQSDCIDFLKQLPSEIVQCCVTSPPYYGLRSYSGDQDRIWGGSGDCDHTWGSTIPGRKGNPNTGLAFTGTGSPETRIGRLEERGAGTTDSGQFCSECGAWKGGLGLEPNMSMYVDHLVEVFREVRRVLRNDGILWLNVGDSYYADSHIREIGQERFQQKGDDGYDGTLAPKRDGSGRKRRNLSSEPDLKKKDLMGVPWRVAFALQQDGWWLRSAIPWVKTAVMPESVRDRPSVSHEYVFLLSKADKYFYDPDAVRIPLSSSTIARDRTPRGRSQAGGGSEKSMSGYDYSDPNLGNMESNSTGRNRRTGDWHRESMEIMAADLRSQLAHVERILAGDGMLHDPAGIPISAHSNPRPFKEAHFAVFPEALIEPMIKAGSPSQACSKCGSPWIRRIERIGGPQGDHAKFENGEDGANEAVRHGPRRDKRSAAGTTLSQRYKEHGYPEYRTTGFDPRCECGSDQRPAIILDPFFGSGTVGVVAARLGRDWIGCDISMEYCEIAKGRLERSGDTSIGMFLDL